MTLALSRSCHLADFPDCHSVAAWQQALAIDAWTHRAHENERLPQTDAETFGMNWSGCAFEVPGSRVSTGQREGDLLNRPVGSLTAIFALSVIDRIEAPQRFFSYAATRLRQGGLLLCTFAAWDATGPDTAVGHEIRKRIYTWETRAMRRVVADLRADGLRLYGGVDWRYHGDQLGDHTLASLVFQKQGAP